MSAVVIYLTELDLTRLENAAARAGSGSPLGGLVDDLIARANVVPGEQIPANVVTMRSVVRVADASGEVREWTLAYPEEADLAAGKLSVLSPMGAALLGRRISDDVEYTAPNGATRVLRLEGITFQPEASGQLSL